MNKRLIAIGTVGTIGALAVSQIIHGYFNIMGRSDIPQSLLSKIVSTTVDDLNELGKFTESKLEWIRKQSTERLELISVTGDRLSGYLTCPEKPSKVYVLFAHGYHADHNGDPANFMQYYIEKGYNFLSMDHIASGESEGKFVGFDYFEHQDCLGWIDYLINRFGNDIKIIIHGVSMGGATICMMANKVPQQVKLAISDCPYTSAYEQFDTVVKNAGIKRTKTLLSLFNTINKAVAGYDLKATDVRNSVVNSKVPMLFVHGKDDDFIPMSMSMELYELCKNEKEYLLIDGAKHAESIRVSEAEYHSTLDKFIEKYLGE